MDIISIEFCLDRGERERERYESVGEKERKGGEAKIGRGTRLSQSGIFVAAYSRSGKRPSLNENHPV